MIHNLVFQKDTKKLPVLVCIGICLFFFLISVSGILHHECWLDEIHHWNIAKASHSINQLIFNMRLEGHPLLWNLCLMGIAHETSNLFFMQFFHICLASAASFILLRFAPFTLLVKCSLLLSYFIIYEFNIVSRNYALGVLICWTLCTLLTSSRKNFLLLAFLSGMLAQVHLFFLFISMAVFIISWRLSLQQKDRVIKTGMLVLYLPLLVFAGYCILPAEGFFLTAYNQQSWFSPERLARPLTLLIKAFLHVPDPGRENCWNSNYLFAHYRNYMLLPSILYWFAPLLLFYKRGCCLFLFYFSAICIAVFLYATPLANGIRYYGLVFIVLVMSGWLYPVAHGVVNKRETEANAFIRFRKYTSIGFLILLLVSQFIAAFWIFRKDLSSPFSQASAAASFIKRLGFPAEQIAVSNIAAVSPIAGYLSTSVWSLESHSYRYYSSWDIRLFEFNEQTMFDEMTKCCLAKPGKWLLVANHPYLFGSGTSIKSYSHQGKRGSLTLLRTFNGSMVSTENYYLYLFSCK